MKVASNSNMKSPNPNDIIVSVMEVPNIIEGRRDSAQKLFEIAAEKGSLNQTQANQIAQAHFIQLHSVNKGKQKNPQIHLDQLKKSGYEYKEVKQSGDKPLNDLVSGTMEVKMPYVPAHGEAVKIESASETEPKNDKSASVETSSDESFFKKNKTVLIIGSVLVVIGVGYYFYTKSKK